MSFIGKMFGAGNKNTSSGPLQKYSYSSSGDMRGSSTEQIVVPVDEKSARISLCHKEWHGDHPKVEEFLVDIGVMEALKEIYCKYSMDKWHKKDFTDEFVCDGASYDYQFVFGRKEVTSFSSQIYPDEYQSKLNELHETVKRFMETGVRLPGLVLPEGEKEQADRKPEDGIISFDVDKYCAGSMSCIFGNGTAEKIMVNGDISLFRAGETEPILHLKDALFVNLWPGLFGTSTFLIPEQLAVGKYHLEAGGYNCDFEVK